MAITQSKTCRAICLDASALVKLYVDEEGSEVVRQFVNSEPTRYTTSLCFHEALTLLKIMYLYRSKLSRDQYNDAVFDLVVWFRDAATRYEDLDFTSPLVLPEVQRIASLYNLDISDAFQILSVKEGYFRRSPLDSKTILVTADCDLAKAATAEGLRVWNCLKEPAP